jgi:hypothetical protein
MKGREMNTSVRSLSDVATVIRSKNAGPFVITFDVFFKDGITFEKVIKSGSITRSAVAQAFSIKETEIVELTFFKPANALKISMNRRKASGAPGDTDVFGAQQHVPLMKMNVAMP